MENDEEEISARTDLVSQASFGRIDVIFRMQPNQLPYEHRLLRHIEGHQVTRVYGEITR